MEEEDDEEVSFKEAERMEYRVVTHGGLKDAHKFIAETASVFHQLQGYSNTLGGGELRLAAVQMSKYYRACLRMHFIELQTQAERGQDAWGCPLNPSTSPDDLLLTVLLFKNAEMLWHLIELLYVLPSPANGAVAPLVIEWYQAHYTMAREGEWSREQERTPAYWRYMYGLALEGSLKLASRQLSQHSSASTEHFQIAIRLLRSSPRLLPSIPVSDFLPQWAQWQSQCAAARERIQAEAPASPLVHLLAILSGDEHVIRQECSEESWLLELVALLLYHDPTVSLSNLRLLTERVVALRGGEGSLRAVERVALRALNADLLGALGLMAQADPIGSRWLAAHLADLLHHCRQLPHDLLVPSTQLPLRDTYLLEYAEELLADEGQQYLPLADYLSACFAEAAPRVRALLGLAVTRVRPRSETEAGRLLALCERFELEPEARSVLVAQAARRIAARRYGAAIRCLARAHDSLRLALLAKRLLEQLAQQDEEREGEALEQVVDSLGEAAATSPKLVFLARYRELRRLLARGEHPAAARLLLSLLTSRIAPRRFWIDLLLLARPLLQGGGAGLLDAEGVHTLLGCLEEVLQSHRRQEYLEPSRRRPRLELQKDLQSLHLALTHSLAQAIVLGGGGGGGSSAS